MAEPTDYAFHLACFTVASFHKEALSDITEQLREETPDVVDIALQEYQDAIQQGSKRPHPDRFSQWILQLALMDGNADVEDSLVAAIDSLFTQLEENVPNLPKDFPAFVDAFHAGLDNAEIAFDLDEGVDAGNSGTTEDGAAEPEPEK